MDDRGAIDAFVTSRGSRGLGLTLHREGNALFLSGWIIGGSDQSTPVDVCVDPTRPPGAWADTLRRTLA